MANPPFPLHLQRIHSKHNAGTENGFSRPLCCLFAKKPSVYSLFPAGGSEGESPARGGHKRSSGRVVSMDTGPDSYGNEIALGMAADSSRWQPPRENLVTREENQQTPAAPEYDNQESQQMHAAGAALPQAQAAGDIPLLPPVGRTPGHHRLPVNAYPLTTGVEAGLLPKGWGGLQAQECPVPAGTLPPGNQLQVPQPLLLGQLTHPITQPVRCAAGARSTGPLVSGIGKQPARARRAPSALKQEHTRKQKASARQNKADAKEIAEKEKGSRLNSSLRPQAPEQLEQLPAQHHPSHYCHPPQQHGFPANGQLEADPDLQTIITVFQELGPAGFAQLAVAVESADRAARRRVATYVYLPRACRRAARSDLCHVVREQSNLDYDRFADKFADMRLEERGPEQTCWAAYRPVGGGCMRPTAQPPPKLLFNQQPSLAPSSSTTSSTASASPPPSPPLSISSPPDVARSPQVSVELMEWLLAV